MFPNSKKYIFRFYKNKHFYLRKKQFC